MSASASVARRNGWAARSHAGWWAFALHRASGLALALFLPLHFVVLGGALEGEAALDGFLRWTDRPWVKASEVALVFLLAVHMTGGVRLLFIEWHGFRAGAQAMLIATAIGVATFIALLFALQLP